MNSKRFTAMEQERIKALLNKFYEGTSSEEEEAQLREYLSEPLLSESLSADADYVSMYQADVPEPSDDFYNRLEEVTHLEAQLPMNKRVLRYAMSIAATAVVLAAMYFLADYLRSGSMKDTYSDPEIAMAEVKNILTVVSNNMKAGTEPLGSIRTISIAPEAMSGLRRINNVVGNSLNNLHYLNKLNTTEKDSKNN
jgi:hypothetical protein